MLLTVNYSIDDIFGRSQTIKAEKTNADMEDINKLILKVKKSKPSECYVFVEAENHCELEDENLQKIIYLRFGFDNLQDQQDGLFEVCYTLSTNSEDIVKMNIKELKKVLKAYTAKDC